MRFMIDDLPVLFPYPSIYPEQVAYMRDIKRTLDVANDSGEHGHCLLEMPSGTGKTVSLLSVIVAYQLHHHHHHPNSMPEMHAEQGGVQSGTFTIQSTTPSKPSHQKQRKLIYCSRTVPEIEKALEELRRLMDYRASVLGRREEFLGLGLTSRKNFCLNAEVNQERRGSVVDAKCRELTSPWSADNGKSCSFFDGLEAASAKGTPPIPMGVYTLEELKHVGELNTMCPYFLARKILPMANVVIYSYHYLLDPKIADLVSKEFSRDSIVVFDESHNIDSVCTESLSLDVTRPMLDASARSLSALASRIETLKESSSARLQGEYERLVQGLREANEARANQAILANPILPQDVLQEAVPGNIRKAEHFVAFLTRFVEYLKTRMRVLHVVAESPTSFLHHLQEVTYIDRKPLRFCAERLASLIRTLELSDLAELTSLQKIVSFATLVSTYTKGFILILEPYENDGDTIPNPVLHFTCLDATLCIKPVFERFKSVIITSGTLSPLEVYPTLLGFTPVLTASYSMSLSRQAFLPLMISRGGDQVAISTQFSVRNDVAVVRNFGGILVEFCKVVPDGIVAFFPSYLYMESIVAAWNESGVLAEVLKLKLIFIETPDAAETSVALENYRRACDTGRGAVLLSVARGKVSEGVDFDHHYGRAVILFGIPYQYTESRILKARLEYLRDTYGIRENDFLTFDAMRHGAQCLGRVIRGKSDYGIMIFADQRFSRNDKRTKLPKWIASCVSDACTNLSTDMAVVVGKKFLRSMGQPYEEVPGVSLLDERGVDTFLSQPR